MDRTATVLRVQSGREADYRDWLGQSATQLAPVYEREGVVHKTVLMAGTRLIVHYEGAGSEALARAYDAPESRALLGGDLAGILADSERPAIYEEVFAWQAPAPGDIERAGLVLSTQPGKADAYREWVQRPATLAELEPLWVLNDVYRHDVLQAGESLIAYYECRSRFNVLKAFREPAALALLFGELGTLLELDPTTPMNLFEEVYAWRSSLAPVA